MGGASSDGVPHDLKQMLEPGCVVNIDISDAITAIHEKSELKVSVAIFGFEAASRGIP